MACQGQALCFCTYRRPCARWLQPAKPMLSRITSNPLIFNGCAVCLNRRQAKQGLDFTGSAGGCLQLLHKLVHRNWGLSLKVLRAQALTRGLGCRRACQPGVTGAAGGLAPGLTHSGIHWGASLSLKGLMKSQVYEIIGFSFVFHMFEGARAKPLRSWRQALGPDMHRLIHMAQASACHARGRCNRARWPQGRAWQ